MNGHQSMVELLLDRGVDIDQKDDNYGEFILSISLCIHFIINLPFH